MVYWSALHKSIFIIGASIVFFSCMEKPIKVDYQNIDIKSSNKKIDFCNSQIFEWDSILIIRPYMRVNTWKNLNIQNLNALEDELSVMESIDWKNYLIFIDNNIAIAYSDVPRDYFDFMFEGDATNPQYISKQNCVLNISSNYANLTLEVPMKK